MNVRVVSREYVVTEGEPIDLVSTCKTSRRNRIGENDIAECNSPIHHSQFILISLTSNTKRKCGAQKIKKTQNSMIATAIPLSLQIFQIQFHHFK